MKFLAKIFLVLLLFVVLVACDSKQEGITQLRPNDVILAFGDSLTLGVGARPELSYPRQLAIFLSRTVTNAGVSGETSAEGLSRLPGVLDKVEPKLMILCHGGNDILQKLDRDQLQANLRGMIIEAQQRGIAVVMIAVPQLVGLQDVPLYKALADELKVPLVPDALRKLLSEQQYKSDPVHLNGQGYRKLAEAVADVLAANGAL
jgi:lysophospholipase L1-like esterase